MDELNSALTNKPTWCPGCGNFGIWQALKNVVTGLSLKPQEVVAVFDIGCNSNMTNWSPVTVFESLHGRTLPVATGLKIAKPELTVLAIAGDGGCYGEGGNHLLHAAKRNLDITLLVHDNQIYALTAGQTSPTSGHGFKTKSTPEGSVDFSFNPLAIALSAGASFVARGFAGDLPQLTGLITQAIQHKGFAIVDILQPCVTFNPVNTFDWVRQRVYDLGKEGYKPDNKLKALEKALEWPKNGEDSKIPLGILFKEEREAVEKFLAPKGDLSSDFEEMVNEFI